MFSVPASKASHKGFTLVELLIVICIIGILSLIALPRLKNALPQYYLKAAVRELVGNLQQARMNAVKDHKPWGVVFGVANNRYQIWNAGDDDTWGTSDDKPVVTVRLDDYGSDIQYGPGGATTDVSGNPMAAPYVTFTASTVVFSSRGFSSTTDGYCYFQNENSDAYAVGVLNSGAVSLRRWNGSDWE